MGSNVTPSGQDLIQVQPEWERGAHFTRESLDLLRREAAQNSDEFWGKLSESLSWFASWNQLKEIDLLGSGDQGIKIRWFLGGKLNLSYNCIDRHLEKRGDQVALIWEGDDPKTPIRRITYRELHEAVCRLANVLKSNGVKKGDRVTLYLPQIPEAAFAMLACARIGAIHSVVFGGFSPEALADRIRDGESRWVITADGGMRGGKKVPLKENVDLALKHCPGVERVFVVPHLQESFGTNLPHGKNPGVTDSGRDRCLREAMRQASPVCEPEWMDSEDPLFILYTSGSTNKPKGVLHTSAGYLLWASVTHRWVFDYRPGEVYWCTADVGWVTGHSYVVYGPLANGATTLLFEGVPHYPSFSRFWEVVDRHQVNILYTAPTAIRALMREGEDPLASTHRKSLRVLGSVGEPINPEAWLWYFHKVGGGRCPIVDTWWQTETGGILISPVAGATALKPGSATQPLPGIEPILVDEQGRVLEGPATGNLCLAGSWPGQMRSLYRDPERFKQTYFSTYPGLYFTGDGCRRDEDGYYWITGRVDDVLNVAGHRLGTAEIESALVAQGQVAEAAVVGCPHEIKGQGIYAFVTLKQGISASDALKKELVQWVRKEISPIASPDAIQFAPGLPKTRSGKIMRRILRKIVEGQFDQLGDTSTLADPSVVTQLIENRQLVGS
jgi:acetyl-CoA synthetase